ncbi:MAG TPA: hypothetical protein VFL55_18075 [Acetobacteraceae bacterium]|nr:hypothetical protein [Acetobacteraceae bacterium]
MTTMLLALAAVLIAMIASTLFDPRRAAETDEDRARAMEAIANAIF